MMRSATIRLALAACMAMGNAEAQEGASNKPPGVPLIPGVLMERTVEYGRVGSGQASAGARALVLDVLRPVEPSSTELPSEHALGSQGLRLE
jgi:hypothetical protein